MPLTFDISRCKDYDEKYSQDQWAEKWHPVTESLVFHCMNGGIGKITEDNAAEVYARVVVLEDIYQNGNSWYSPGENGQHVYHRITPENVRDHIGMTVNVSDITRTAFIKRHISGMMDDKKNSYLKATV